MLFCEKLLRFTKKKSFLQNLMLALVLKAILKSFSLRQVYQRKHFWKFS